MKEEKQSELGSTDQVLLDKIEEIRKRLLSDEAVREKIAYRAYEIFEHSGGTHGRQFDDWLQAENEILSPLIEQELVRASEVPALKATESAASEAAVPPSGAPAAKKSRAPTPASSASTRTRKAKGRESKPAGSKRAKKEAEQ